MLPRNSRFKIIPPQQEAPAKLVRPPLSFQKILLKLTKILLKLTKMLVLKSFSDEANPCMSLACASWISLCFSPLVQPFLFPHLDPQSASSGALAPSEIPRCPSAAGAVSRPELASPQLSLQGISYCRPGASSFSRVPASWAGWQNHSLGPKKNPQSRTFAIPDEQASTTAAAASAAPARALRAPPDCLPQPPSQSRTREFLMIPHSYSSC